MKIIRDENMKKIKGGISGWAIAGISLIVTFVAGVFDGIARPRKCNN